MSLIRDCKSATQTLCGRKLDPESRFIDAIVKNVQTDAIKERDALGISPEKTLKAVRAVRKQWGKANGYPGFPMYAIYDLWEGRTPDLIEDVIPAYVAGVFIFLDRAIALDRKGQFRYSACFVENAVLLLGQLRSFHNERDAGTSEVDELAKLLRSQMAKMGAAAKNAKDPKQSEKGLVRDCWKNWKLNPHRYPSKAAFARDMLTKCEHLTSQKKIEDWCREWETKAGTLPAE